MTAGLECTKCKLYSAGAGEMKGKNFVCSSCLDAKEQVPTARKANLPTENQEKKLQEAMKKQKEAKQNLLKKVHKMLKKMKKEDLIAWIEKYDSRIKDAAKQLRMRGRIPELHQQQIEHQLATKTAAVLYQGYWVQSYMGNIPILVKETIDELCQKDQK